MPKNGLYLRRALKASLYALAAVAFTPYAYSQSILWEAFNDYAPGVDTSPNATGYEMRLTADPMPLKNILTGEDLTATLAILQEGGTPDAFGANTAVNPNTPADKLFKGKVTIGNDGISGLRASTQIKITLVFENLDPSKRYKFRGTSSRGGNYNDRWSYYGIVGADSYVDAHEDGSLNKNIITKKTFPTAALNTNEVALNSGDNKAGSLVGWDNIEPGADGSFSVEAQQYGGPTPFGNAATAAASSYAYGFTAIYLAAVEATGNLKITENPPLTQLLPAGSTATLKVTATSPQTITYQWQKAPPGTTNFANIANATTASYTTPVLTVADEGSVFRALLTSGTAKATSGEATVHVDGVLPALTNVVGSINFNAAYLDFSEAMDLEKLGVLANYSIAGLAISNVFIVDSSTVKLSTGTQTPGTKYTVTVNNLTDVAGNKIPNNTSGSFNAFIMTTNVVGVEMWWGIGGGAPNDLRNNAAYPLSPTLDFSASTFNSELVVTNGPFNTYGGRIRGYLTPTETADYIFFIRGDDQAELRINLEGKFDDIDSVDIAPDAVDTTAGDPFQEPDIDASVTVPMHLVKGQKIAVQLIWKESNGNDYGQLAWRKVGDVTPADQLQPIPSQFWSYWGPGAASPVVEPKITKVSFEGGKVVITWTGAGLQSSTDLKTWTDEAGAASPFSVTPTGRKFYRAKN
jgi:hypothetical protein